MKNRCLIFGLTLMALLFCVSKINAQCTPCSLTGDSNIEVGFSKTYSVGVAGSASYFWSVTGNLIINGSNTGSSVSIKGSSAGSGKVCVTRFSAAAEPCCSCKDISILQPTNLDCEPWYAPLYAINLITGFPKTVCPNESFAVGLSTSIPSTHYVVWSISPGIAPSFGDINNHKASYLEFIDGTQYTQYNVSVSYYCNNGTPSSLGQTLTVMQSSLNCDYEPAIVASGRMSVHPNPGSKEITLELPQSKFDYRCVILSDKGEVKYQGTLNAGSHIMDLSLYERGVYYLRAFRSDNWAGQLHFVKQ